MNKEAEPWDHHFLEDASPDERLADEDADRRSAFRRVEDDCPELARALRASKEYVNGNEAREAAIEYLEAKAGSKEEEEQFLILAKEAPRLARELKGAKDSIDGSIPMETISSLEDYWDESERTGIHTIPRPRK